MLQEEGTRLQKLYPGDNVQQIALQQRALSDAWAALQSDAKETRRVLQQHLALQQFLTQVLCDNINTLLSLPTNLTNNLCWYH